MNVPPRVLFFLLVSIMFPNAGRAFLRLSTLSSSRAATSAVTSAASTGQRFASVRPPVFSSRGLCAAAADGPDTSVVDVCQQKIQDALEADNVVVTGAYDDPNGSHVSIEVVSSLFEGKRPVQRQQLVYKAIWEELQGPVHAVDSMVCKTPDEA